MIYTAAVGVAMENEDDVSPEVAALLKETRAHLRELAGRTVLFVLTMFGLVWNLAHLLSREYVHPVSGLTYFVASVLFIEFYCWDLMTEKKFNERKQDLTTRMKNLIKERS